MLDNKQVAMAIQKDGLVYFFRHYCNVQSDVIDCGVATLLMVIQQFTYELEKMLDIKIEL